MQITCRYRRRKLVQNKQKKNVSGVIWHYYTEKPEQWRILNNKNDWRVQRWRHTLSYSCNVINLFMRVKKINQKGCFFCFIRTVPAVSNWSVHATASLVNYDKVSGTLVWSQLKWFVNINVEYTTLYIMALGWAVFIIHDHFNCLIFFASIKTSVCTVLSAFIVVWTFCKDNFALLFIIIIIREQH